jgi:hypothetical protein
MISKDEAIEIARAECLRRGWDDAPPYSAQSGREYMLWGKRTWFVVSNADQQGNNAYIHIDADTGDITGAAFATEEDTRKRRGIWSW